MSSAESHFGLLDSVVFAVRNGCVRVNFAVWLLIYLKGCGTTLKEAPPAAARETLPIVATNLECTAQCGTVSVPPITGPPKMSKLWRIRTAAQFL